MDPVAAGSGVVDRGATILLRPSENDMFRLGSAEAEALGYDRGYAAGLAAGLTAAEADLP
jgi:hypothetical protein